MISTPFWMYIASMLFWLASALLASRGRRIILSVLVMIFAVMQLIAAIWGAVAVNKQAIAVSLGHAWFKLGGLQEITVQLDLDPMTSVLWVVLALVSVFFAFFNLFGKASDIKATNRQLTIFPALATMVWMAVCSSNVITLYVGWFVSAFFGFLSLVVDSAESDDQAIAAKRYAALNIIAAILFSIGLLGVYKDYQTFSFSEIASKTQAPSFGFVLCLVFATILRGMQLPFKEMATYIGKSRHAVISVSVLSHLMVAPVIFLKLYPQILSAYEIHDLALIPAITGLIAAIELLSEKSAPQIVSHLAVIVSSFVLSFGLLGDFQASMALLVSGAVTLLFLAWTLLLGNSIPNFKKYLLCFAALSFSGAPLSSWGWSQLLQYTDLLSLQTSFSGLSWILLTLKFVTDFLVGVFAWKCFWESSNESVQNKNEPKEVMVVLALFALTTLAVSQGGRPFGGLFGESGLEFFSPWCWFEKVFGLRAGSLFMQKDVMELLGANEDLFARGISVGMFLIPSLIAGLWLFRDAESIREFEEKSANFSRAIKGPFKERSLLWEFGFLPLSRVTNVIVSKIELVVLDEYIERISNFTKFHLKRLMILLEQTLLDAKLVDGAAQVVMKGGKLVRRVHNGQVQFYVSLGLFLFVLIILRFILLGG